MTQGTADRVVLTVPSHSKYLPLLRSVVQEGAVLSGFDREAIQGILLAVTEAVTNVIRHAYGGDTGRRIDLQVQAGPARLGLDLVDYGKFVDPSRIASRPLGDVRPGGLGVHLIKSTMDHVEYRENAHGGTTLNMVIHSPAKKEPS